MTTLTGFRELLMKRADAALQAVIAKIADGDLAVSVIESLQKMSRKGDSANHAIAASAGHVLPEVAKDHPHESMDAALLHDNLSHHLTKYKAALKAGDRSTANQHLENVMRTMQYGAKLEGASNGGVRLRSGSTATEHGKEGQKLLSPTPWEMNYSGSEVGSNGRPTEVTKGWNRKLTQGRKATDMFPDYQYLEMAPHEHNSVHTYGHEGAYPFHDLQVNGRHVVVDNAEHSGKFEPHVFDSHPGRAHAYTTSPEMTPAVAHKFAEDHKAWMQHPELDAWIGQQETKHDDPMHSTMHGAIPSDPIHDVATANPHDLSRGRRALKGGGKPAEAQPSPQAAPPTPAAAVEQAPASKIVAALHGANIPHDQISKMTGIPVDKIKTMVGK
jgi:hypothetical protein